MPRETYKEMVLEVVYDNVVAAFYVYCLAPRSYRKKAQKILERFILVYCRLATKCYGGKKAFPLWRGIGCGGRLYRGSLSRKLLFLL